MILAALYIIDQMLSKRQIHRGATITRCTPSRCSLDLRANICYIHLIAEITQNEATFIMKKTSTGIEQLIGCHLNLVRGRRVGLVTNASAVLADLTDTQTALQSAGVRIAALFSPEHGLYDVEADGAAVASGRGSDGLPYSCLWVF